jgi:hypothetical protein
VTCEGPPPFPLSLSPPGLRQDVVPVLRPGPVRRHGSQPHAHRGLESGSGWMGDAIRLGADDGGEDDAARLCGGAGKVAAPGIAFGRCTPYTEDKMIILCMIRISRVVCRSLSQRDRHHPHRFSASSLSLSLSLSSLCLSYLSLTRSLSHTHTTHTLSLSLSHSHSLLSLLSLSLSLLSACRVWVGVTTPWR